VSPANNGDQEQTLDGATYQGDISHNNLGSRANTVMITGGYNNSTQADLQTLQAALLFLQMQLKHIWHHQNQFQVINEMKPH
jgi:hypothetical protein